MTAYKRFIIPLKASDGISSGGRCLVERTAENNGRITLTLQGVSQPSLDLWLFDDKQCHRYPKTLHPDKMRVINLRQPLNECGIDLSQTRCICLLDSNRQPVYVGYNGTALDWQKIMLNGGSYKPETKIEENASEENFKQEVKNLIEQLDDELSRPLTAAENTVFTPAHPLIPDDIQWHKITVRELSGHKKLWKYARNPFVCDGCRSYHHLLVGENDKHCFLGVPCRENDRFNGISQGFRIFTTYNNADYCFLKQEK